MRTDHRPRADGTWRWVRRRRRQAASRYSSSHDIALSAIGQWRGGGGMRSDQTDTGAGIGGWVLHGGPKGLLRSTV